MFVSFQVCNGIQISAAIYLLDFITFLFIWMWDFFQRSAFYQSIWYLRDSVRQSFDDISESFFYLRYLHTSNVEYLLN